MTEHSTRSWWAQPPEPAPLHAANQWWNETGELSASDTTSQWWGGIAVQREPNTETPADQVTEFPRGAGNPFNDFVEKALSHFDNLHPEGEAEIPTHQWISWRDRTGIYWMQQGQEPEKTRTLNYSEIARRNHGWKLHLNFDAENPAKVRTVGTLLTSLAERGAINQFKIGRGGGKKANQPGKEATVYVGHRDTADIVAPIIEEALQGILDTPDEDALRDDISFTEYVIGRFDIGGRIDPEFHQYGAKGHGILDADMQEGLTTHTSQIIDETSIEVSKLEAAARADAVLCERYGAFYTGTQTSL